MVTEIQWIVVGAVTRRRPLMFADLLMSFETLRLPENTKLSFCFVENDDTLSITEKVSQFGCKSGFDVQAILETQLGIPFARNSVLNWAVDAGADYLVFIDDDEMASPDWLLELYLCQKNSAADLVGGPVHPIAPSKEIGLWPRIHLKGLQLRGARMTNKNTTMVAVGAAQKITVTTNNWLLRLNFLRQHGLRFDEGLGFSGGSDAAFCRALKKLDGRVSWTNKAMGFETMPMSRLTLRYQFKRGRDQSISSFRIRFDKTKHPLLLLRSLVFCLSKLLLGIVRLSISLFDGGKSLVLAMRAFGFAWGRILALAGHTSSHYKKPHGS